MSQELKEQLSKDVDIAHWKWLSDHAQRDAVIVVNASLDLVDVGVAIATDNTQVIQHWIAEQLLIKPTETEIIEWDAQVGKSFPSLIIQPFVLIQDKKEESSSTPATA